MAVPAWKDLGTLRTELQARLGFSNVGTQQTTILNSFLADAQEQLYNQFDYPHLKVMYDMALAANDQFMLWPDIINPDRLAVVQVDTGAGVWEKLDKGIDYLDDSFSPGGWPLKYDDGYDEAASLYKVEFWPIPTQAWTVRFEGTGYLGAFAADTDKASLPDRHIFLFALANAKAHYRHPDAQVYGEQVQAFTRKMRAVEHRGRRYIKGQEPQPIPPVPRMA